MVCEEIAGNTHLRVGDSEALPHEPTEQANYLWISVAELGCVPALRSFSPVEHATRHVQGVAVRDPASTGKLELAPSQPAAFDRRRPPVASSVVGRVAGQKRGV